MPMKKTYIFIALAVIIVGVGLYSCTRPSAPPEPAQQVATAAANDYHDNIYVAQGGHMRDFAGTTLYTFDQDSAGVSNCNDACAKTWKPYTSGAVSQGTFPQGISVITRADGSKQFAWQGKPLYYFNEDVNAGDTKGDGKNGAWHIVAM